MAEISGGLGVTQSCCVVRTTSHQAAEEGHANQRDVYDQRTSTGNKPAPVSNTAFMASVAAELCSPNAEASSKTSDTACLVSTGAVLFTNSFVARSSCVGPGFDAATSSPKDAPPPRAAPHSALVKSSP
ncbi:uncharacterized protein PITG_16766 [Phytophthora infestans T30-4]|uniref:Uncharacterized protein n=1 Tax=Phytophthora infestans (strain T30-4) TaxID=403677 RepID=D0NUV1_PHYIT|nr:uncharacterized protein PITG_16766 [Phytophthora infestans T30-4]EEY65474.1 hypothetical protein PITG_16766 [Phytophthora infestans T30-4]|eukprot:XP_002897103.1 hypothetical protein PITG_16766 [Phytophthora infestans T30-4]